MAVHPLQEFTGKEMWILMTTQSENSTSDDDDDDEDDASSISCYSHSGNFDNVYDFLMFLELRASISCSDSDPLETILSSMFTSLRSDDVEILDYLLGIMENGLLLPMLCLGLLDWLVDSSKYMGIALLIWSTVFSTIDTHRECLIESNWI